MTQEPRAAVLDTSAIVKVKQAIVAERQWEFFERLKDLVLGGRVYFPMAVRNELRQERYHDTPETWALNVYEHMEHTYEPGEDSVIEVMQRAGNVVEEDAEGEPADPYVLAQALEFRRRGLDIVIVTEDRINRLPIKIDMATACGRLGIDWITLEAYMAEIGFDPRRGWSTASA